MLRPVPYLYFLVPNKQVRNDLNKPWRLQFFVRGISEI